MEYLVMHNQEVVALDKIPVLDYDRFYTLNLFLIHSGDAFHCLSYFGVPFEGGMRCICMIADDRDSSIYVTSFLVKPPYADLPALSAQASCFQNFERELHENFGIHFSGHPWLKPVRYAWNRADVTQKMDAYPFFQIAGDELHEVGVGPIHAGIIEPGHFRFICNGEQIIHLEIQLGYQHRGVEALFKEKKTLNERISLSESIAGDTVVGHASVFSWLWEAMHGYEPDSRTSLERTIALELERIAIHTGDLAALCTDLAYQLGSAVFGRLRTPIVNFFQEWCGNRLAKGIIRPGMHLYTLTPELSQRLLIILDTYEKDLDLMWRRIKTLPSLLSRMERTGIVSYKQVLEAGAVGMTARMAGLSRDVRQSHPFGLFRGLRHQPIIKRHGDVYSRTQIRYEEIKQSIQYIRTWLSHPLPDPSPDPIKLSSDPLPLHLGISIAEGWRGEICHCAVTDEHGELIMYKIKDPSFHNWLILTLAVRNNEISDFPVINKSFNLSYCGFDL